MGKLPPIERDAVSGSLTYETASRWLMFMAEEVDMDGDATLANSYRQRALSLMHARMPRGFLHDKNLEAEISKWMKKRDQA